MLEGASVSVDFDDLVALLDAYRRRGGNQREAMRFVATMLVEEVDEMFETSGHGQWPPLAASTRKYRGDSARLLMDTGRLAASITAAATSNTAEAFTNVSYAKYHVSDEEPRRHVPKRDFFAIDMEPVLDEFVDFLIKEIAE